jgi:hypothetical protein
MAMGYYKNFDLFCRERELNADKDISHALYRIKLRRNFTADEEQMIRSHRIARQRRECPVCHVERDYEESFSRWRCYYCGHTERDCEGPQEDPPLAREVQHELRKDRKTQALRLWRAATSIANTPVIKYLAARGLEPPPNAHEVLRWHPNCPYGERGKVGCMVALFRDALTDEPVAIHRTHIISASGGEAERMALGPIKGAVVKLWPLGDSSTLAIGEGIETTLAAVKLGHAFAPAWAATVANNLSAVPYVMGVIDLTILADNDVSCVGQQAAKELYFTFWRQGAEATILMPRKQDADFNTILKGLAK